MRKCLVSISEIFQYFQIVMFIVFANVIQKEPFFCSKGLEKIKVNKFFVLFLIFCTLYSVHMNIYVLMYTYECQNATCGS